VLSIGHNGLREDGMSSLVVALRTLPRLHSLNVTHNAMGAAGLRRLLDDGLPALPNLGHLCLGECNALDESALSEVLGECALRHSHGWVSRFRRKRQRIIVRALISTGALSLMDVDAGVGGPL